MSLGRPPHEALSFLSATANVCVPSSEGRLAEPMGYPIVDRALRRLIRNELGENPLCREVRRKAAFVNIRSKPRGRATPGGATHPDHFGHLKKAWPFAHSPFF